LLFNQLLQMGFSSGGQQRLASASASSGLECAPLLELLPDPAHRRHTETEKPGNVAGAFALFVEVDDALTGR